jgi:ribosomal protein S18 acetylase RimI-like enzyme
MTDAELVRLDGPRTLEIFEELQAVYRVAFPESDLGDHTWRTTNQAQTAGFAAVTARVDGALVGFAYGLPLRANTSWWSGLDPEGPEGFAAETGSRTFAVIDLAVLPAQRGKGLGRRLMSELLASRTEERATLATAPRKVENQRMYERWGWRKVGRVQGSARTTESVFELYVIALRLAPAATSSR